MLFKSKVIGGFDNNMDRIALEKYSLARIFRFEIAMAQYL